MALAFITALALLSASFQSKPSTFSAELRQNQMTGDAKISLDANAWSIEKILKNVDQQTGLKLASHGDISSDIVVAHLANVSTKEFEAKLANLVWGKWVPSNDGSKILVRDDSKINQSESELVQKQTQAFDEQKALLSSFQKIIIYGPDSLPQPQNQGPLPDGVVLPGIAKPAQIFSRSLFLDIASKTLAQPYRGIPVVFALHPNAMQQGFDGNAAKDFENFKLNEANYFKAEMAQLAKEGETLPPGLKLPVPESFLLEERSGPLNFVQLSLTVYDSNGKEMDMDSFNVNLNGKKESPYGQFLLDEAGKAVIHPTLSEIEWSNFILHAQQPGSKPMTQAMFDQVSQPEKNDPFSFTSGPEVIQSAIALNRNLMMTGDEIIRESTYYQVRNGAVQVSQILKPNYVGGVNAVAQPNWLLIQPADPLLALHQKANRSDLATLFKTLSPTKGFSLNSLGQFFANHGPYLCPVITSISWYKPYSYPDPALLCLYGLMTEGQKSKLASKGLPFHDLSSVQKEACNYVVFGGFNSMWPVTDKRDRTGFVNPSYMGQATEALPNGILPDDLLTGKIIHKPVVVYQTWLNMVDMTGKVTGGRPSDLEFGDPAMVARETNFTNEKFLNFGPGSQDSLALRFIFSNKWKLDASFQIAEVTGSMTEDWHDLPKPLADEMSAYHAASPKSKP